MALTEEEYNKQHPEAKDIYAGADVPGTISGLAAKSMDTLKTGAGMIVTPPGGFDPGSSTAYRAGQVINSIAGSMKSGASDVGSAASDVGSAVGNAAKDFYKGARGINYNYHSDVDAMTGAAPTVKPPAPPAGAAATPAAAAPAPATPVAATPGKAGAPRGRPLLTNPWANATRSDVPMQAMTGGLFASGQGQSEDQSYYEWTTRNGNKLQKVMLPAGVDPRSLSKEQLAAFKPYDVDTGDTGQQVSVVRGLREFKGGKEIEDGMTAERKQQQQMSSVISSLSDAKNQGVDQVVVGGIISSLGTADTKAKADILSAQLTAQAHERAARIAASVKESIPDFNKRFKTDSYKITLGDLLNPVTYNVPVMFDMATGSRQIVLPEFTITQGADGFVKLPEGVTEDQKKYISTVLNQLTPQLKNMKKE